MAHQHKRPVKVPLYEIQIKNCAAQPSCGTAAIIDPGTTSYELGMDSHLVVTDYRYPIKLLHVYHFAN